ncbi:unnamed protein product, partial [Rotaria magnacalcarata]
LLFFNPVSSTILNGRIFEHIHSPNKFVTFYLCDARFLLLEEDEVDLLINCNGLIHVDVIK